MLRGRVFNGYEMVHGGRFCLPSRGGWPARAPGRVSILASRISQARLKRIWLTAILRVADTCIRHADVWGTRMLMWAGVAGREPV